MTEANEDFIYRCPGSECRSTKITIYHDTITSFGYLDGQKVTEQTVDINSCTYIECDTCGYEATTKTAFELFHDYETEIPVAAAHYTTIKWIGIYQLPTYRPIIVEFESGINEDPFPIMLEQLKDETLDGDTLKAEDFTLVPHDGDNLKIQYYSCYYVRYSITLVRSYTN